MNAPTPELRELPQDAYRWNRAHRGAFLKGQRAFIEGRALDDNPYGDLRKLDGRLTWSRAFVGCWRDGWRHQSWATK